MGKINTYSKSQRVAYLDRKWCKYCHHHLPVHGVVR